ncbi:MAG: LytTR family transcriptional regulator DNA-binding domain-containing protein [Flavobacteriaceae bacterium]|nr:LytTR family transcriptional regulator DNA-binding domain-containing protein [Flavobacteriaceae bacterium]
MKYPYVIIDDDPNTIERIQLAFEKFSNYICVGVAKNEDDGLDLILDRMPALVLMNLEIPGIEAEKILFSVTDGLRKYIDELPKFIMLAKTAEYAIESIRNNALDYLLKPIDVNLLKRSLFRFQREFRHERDKTLCFKSYGDYKFINMDEVVYLKADNNTTDFMLENGDVVGAFKSLKFFQETLPNHFVRIHNSYIVNTHFVSRIHFGKSICRVRASNVFIPFSKSYRHNVEFLKDNLSQKSVVVA